MAIHNRQMFEILVDEIKRGGVELVSLLEISGKLQICKDGSYELLPSFDGNEHTYVIRVKGSKHGGQDILKSKIVDYSKGRKDKSS